LPGLTLPLMMTIVGPDSRAFIDTSPGNEPQSCLRAPVAV
jgi:hypothetical protein